MGCQLSAASGGTPFYLPDTGDGAATAFAEAVRTVDPPDKLVQQGYGERRDAASTAAPTKKARGPGPVGFVAFHAIRSPEGGRKPSLKVGFFQRAKRGTGVDNSGDCSTVHTYWWCRCHCPERLCPMAS